MKCEYDYDKEICEKEYYREQIIYVYGDGDVYFFNSQEFMWLDDAQGAVDAYLDDYDVQVHNGYIIHLYEDGATKVLIPDPDNELDECDRVMQVVGTKNEAIAWIDDLCKKEEEEKGEDVKAPAYSEITLRVYQTGAIELIDPRRNVIASFENQNDTIAWIEKFTDN